MYAVPDVEAHLLPADQLGAEWFHSPFVICRAVPPSAGTTNRCV